MDEAGEGARGMSWEPREREGEPKANSFERSRKTAAKSQFAWINRRQMLKEHTWGRAAVVDEIRCAAEEFCQFTGAPQ